MKLSPQKEIIVKTLRDMKEHCGREWLNRIKDDRKRCSELNEGYMREKGYEIVSQPCKGRICGRAKCPLYTRRAQKLMVSSAIRYDLRHLRPQDYHCNINLSGNWPAFRRNLIAEGVDVDALIEENEATKGIQYPISWFEEKIKFYTQLLTEL